MKDTINKTNKPKIKLSKLHKIKTLLRNNNLYTVCENAKCPNITDCFNRQRATFLIMGETCSRSCKFCNIGQYNKLFKPLDPEEPLRIAKVSQEMKLKHIVITSVTRDDLPDEGANHFAQTIKEIRKLIPNSTIEVLTPDFNAKKELLDIIIQAKPDIFNHNLETIKKLTPLIRSGAQYSRSLDVLKYIKSKNIITKSGIMLGLGENNEEIKQTLQNIKNIGVEIITVGQYYAPSSEHYPVKKYYTVKEFKEIEVFAKSIGINHIYSGANIRSSYMAAEAFTNLKL